MDIAAPSRLEAPGAKASRVCGILAIVCALTCAGIPVGIVLGIVAVVQHAKAKRLALQAPESYATPSSSGLALGIVGLVLPVVMLPFAGIVSAIAIPALLGQRARARDKAAISMMHSKLPELAERCSRAREVGADAMAIQAELGAYLRTAAGTEKSPYNPQAPAFRFTVGMTSAATEEDTAEAARAQATTLGEVVFVISAPVDPQAPRCVAGAVRTQLPADGHEVASKVIRVD